MKTFKNAIGPVLGAVLVIATLTVGIYLTLQP